ncbi:hypothetical protein SAMD00019534_105120, partial [Acytostelium subglobosum LB1]|uniref:hypothetical protein n=1 Tax=Acytostelium subglobosum LB1 TaxID=1410327 RepID=UPI0006451E26
QQTRMSEMQRSMEYPPSSSQAMPMESAGDSQAMYEKEQNLLRWEEELRGRERNLNSMAGSAAPNANSMNMGTGAYPNANVASAATSSELLGSRFSKYPIALFGWTTICLIWNFVCGIAVIVYSAVSDFFITLFFMLVGIPIAWFLTRRLNRAIHNGKAKTHYSAILALTGMLLFSLMFALGFKYSGMHGLIWMISLFHNHHKAVGGLHVISLFFWVVNCVLICGGIFKLLRFANVNKNRGTNNLGFRGYLGSR